MFRRLHAYAFLIASLSAGSGIDFTRPTLAAAAPPDSRTEMLSGRLVGGADRASTLMSIELWNITPPITTDSADARVRMNPKVDVAVATSSWGTVAWIARSGASKSSPMPIPVRIWKPRILATEVVALKLIYRPHPRVIRAVPT